MASLFDDFVAKNPDYAGMDRDKVLRGLHDKFYADQPYDEFVTRATRDAAPKPVDAAPKPATPDANVTEIERRPGDRPGAALGRFAGAHMPERAAEPSPLWGQVGGQGDPVDLIPPYESGNRNVPNYRYDRMHTAQGYWQITDSNWRHYAPMVGVDLSQHPNAMSADYWTQREVAKAMYREQGYAPWAPYNPALRAAISRGETPLAPGLTSGRAEELYTSAREYGLEKRVERAEAIRAAGPPAWLMPPQYEEFAPTGFEPQPEDTERALKGFGRQALGGTAHIIRALDQPETEPGLGEDVAKKLESLIPPAPPAITTGEKATDILSGIAGGLGPAVVQWMGGPAAAVLSGLATAKEIAAEHGTEATAWQSWRDAGVEGLSRLLLGRAAGMPWGRTTTGLTFAAASGLGSLAEGRSAGQAELDALINGVMGLLGKNITPGAQQRIDAARVAAAAGDGQGAMHHLDALLQDPRAAAGIAAAARLRGTIYPDGSGSVADVAAWQEAEEGSRPNRLRDPVQRLEPPRERLPAEEGPIEGQWRYVRRPEAEEGFIPVDQPDPSLFRTLYRKITGQRFNPVARERAKDSIAVVTTQRDRANAFARQISDEGEPLFHGVPDWARVDMITRFMHGDPVYEPYQPWFKKAAEHQENQFLAETLGAELDYEYYENYWHLQWKQEGLARTLSPGMRHNQSPSFMKGKVFDDPSEGLAYRGPNGERLDLKTTNPAVLWSWRQEAGNQAIARVLAMKDMVKDKIAIRQTDLNELSRGEYRGRTPAVFNGYVPVDVGGVRYMIHPEAKKMMDWSLDYGRQGLARILGIDPAGATAAAGDKLYNAVILAKNITVPFKLMFSAFHPLHVLGIDSSQNTSAVLTERLNKRISTADFLKGLKDRSHLGSYAYGAKATENWPKPYDQLSPIDQLNQSLMIGGAYTPARPSIYEIGAARALRRTLNDVIPSLKQKLEAEGVLPNLATAMRVPVEYARAAALMIGKGIEQTQHTMFADWIPAIKTAAYLNQAKMFVATRPDLWGIVPEGSNSSTPVVTEAKARELRRELNKIRRSIDNRFGEMQYDKEFINPLIRKATMASLLSVGWNWGFAREFGGGLLKDLPTTLFKKGLNVFRDNKLQAEWSRRTIYAGTYTAQSLMLGGLITFIMTGERPKDFKDLVYPRLPDGTRVTTMMFTREMGALYYHWMNEGLGPGTLALLAGKLQPGFQSLMEVWNNADYFGKEVRDPNATIFTQVAQGMEHMFEGGIVPISVSSASRNPEGDPAKTALSFGGLSPAPQYVDKDRTLALIQADYNRYHQHPITPYGEVQKRDDMAELKKIFETWQTSGRKEDLEAFKRAEAETKKKYPEFGKRRQAMRQREKAWAMPKGLKMFSDLPADVQKHRFANAPPEDQAWLLPGLKKELRGKIKEFAPNALGRAPTPEELSRFPPDKQEMFLRSIKSGAREQYLPFVDPDVRHRAWSIMMKGEE